MSLLSTKTILDIYAKKWENASIGEITDEINRIESKHETMLENVLENSGYVPTDEEKVQLLSSIRNEKIKSKAVSFYTKNQSIIIIIGAIVILYLLFK